MLLDPDRSTSPDSTTTNYQIAADPSPSMEDQPQYVSAETLSQIEMLRSDNLAERVAAITVLNDIVAALGKALFDLPWQNISHPSSLICLRPRYIYYSNRWKSY